MITLAFTLALLAAAPVADPVPADEPASEPAASAPAAPAPETPAPQPAPPAPPPARSLSDLFAAAPVPPAPPPPPEPGKPPAAGPAADWSVEVGPYAARAQAEAKAAALAAAWPGVAVSDWADATGDRWFTATLAGRTPWQALEAARTLRGQGTAQVRVLAPPLKQPPEEPAK